MRERERERGRSPSAPHNCGDAWGKRQTFGDLEGANTKTELYFVQ